MANFKIPKGKAYSFNLTVLERNSYLPKDLANMDDMASSVRIVKLDDLSVVAGAISIEKQADSKLSQSDPDTYVNGKVKVSVPSEVTSTLSYERGDKVDEYYLKPMYQIVVSIVFTDGTPEIVSVIKDVQVMPIGL